MPTPATRSDPGAYTAATNGDVFSTQRAPVRLVFASRVMFLRAIELFGAIFLVEEGLVENAVWIYGGHSNQAHQL